MKISELADAVVEVLDPQGRGRQYLAAKIRPLAGTRAAGMVLTRKDAVGKWSRDLLAPADRRRRFEW